MGTLTVLLSSSLFLCLLWSLVKFLHKVWWTPIHLQNALRSQGIRGPSYRFIHGNTKEIFNMRKESMSRPMDLSHHVFPRLQPHYYSWIKIYGKNFFNWYGPEAQLVVTELELVKEILNNKDGAYAKAMIMDFVKKLLGDGLVTSDGEKWVKMRKLANHAFHVETVKNTVPAMVKSVETMMEKWKHFEDKEIEVVEQFRLYTSEVISRTAFGSSYAEGKNIFEMLMKLSLIISRNSFRIRFPGIRKLLKSGDDIEAGRLEKEIQDSVMGLMKRREGKVLTGEIENFGSDLLGLLLKAYHEADENKRISVDDIIDECKTFYISGQETSTVLLSWTVLLLAIHPDWQEKARKEVISLFGQQNPTADGIARLKIMSWIIYEVLRLYPPVINITRKVQTEARLGKLIIPAHVHLNVPTLALHHDPEIWGEDAQIFKPERFSSGVAKATNGKAATYIPFGMGPRNCVGMNFATTEAKIALSMILQRYAFTLSPAYVHSPFQVLTLRPQLGVQVMLQAL